ncbi:hypothetical protein GALMADRAFT_405237 [Galerina marginata CBS 339.88]|uniref:F-box domain-containing protein n=1 Tax=Galerina marginata (strain CBS 339.88) TaxID=685588 RepID=A0A067T2R3_GALM3|nr:hypothetical protein GALMADRAFT_405237 [Galerina marginata CBS 339.88]
MQNIGDDTSHQAFFPRRSKRLLSQKNDDEQPVPRLPLPLNKRASRKRKAARKPEERASAKKIRRGFNGHSNFILDDLPVELLLEVLAFAEPMDLLHLARTCKKYRRLLMTRSSVSIWMAARSNVPMPEIPPDLTEPQYANLAFGKECYFYDQELPENQIYWAERFRACLSCMKDPAYFVEKGCDPAYPSELEERLPVYHLPSDIDGEQSHRLVVLLSTKLLWAESYEKADDKEAWIAPTRSNYPPASEYYLWSALWKCLQKILALRHV